MRLKETMARKPTAKTKSKRRKPAPPPKHAKPPLRKSEGQIAAALGDLAETISRLGRPYALEESPSIVTRIFMMSLSHCTQTEAAGRLGVAENTFTDFLKRSPAARDAWDLGRPAGRASLRGRQFTKAMAGGDAMLKWLGINLLGQTNRVAVTGADGGSFEVRTLADFYGGTESAAAA